MPKSKRNKTVDLSKTKKHGLEGKKELYKKIQSNVENYAHVFVFAVNDMRNSKMKNVREQWKQSRFCIGKNKVMAMALGRTPEEEYRPNLHKIGQMLLGERGLLFTNQSIEEVTNWFESYSEGDYARSGNVATQDVILPEGPLSQFPHNLESYLRQLGLPTTLKKGVIHLIKEHVVCMEGDRLSPETARILKLLGYEMAEFRVKILSVWCQDGSFINFHSTSSDPESKENIANDQKSFMREDFELAKDCLLLGDDDEEMEAEVENKVSENIEKETPFEKNTSDIEEESAELKGRKSKQAKSPTQEGKRSFVEAKENAESVESLGDKISCNIEEQGTVTPNSTAKKIKAKSASKGKQTKGEKPESTGSEESVSQNGVKVSSPEIELEVEDVEMHDVENVEPEVKVVSTAKKSRKGGKKSVNKKSDEKEETETDEKASSKEPEVEMNSTARKSRKGGEKTVIKKSDETVEIETDVEVVDASSKESEVKRTEVVSSARKSRIGRARTVTKKSDETVETETDEKASSKEEPLDNAAILKLTEKKLEESAEKPKKFSPKLTRARAAAAKMKVNEPKPVETQRTTRKRKM